MGSRSGACREIAPVVPKSALRQVLPYPPYKRCMGPIIIAETGDNQVAAETLRKVCKIVFPDDVVGIHKGDVLALRQLDAGIACRAHATVFLVDNVDAFARILVADDTGSVAASVIHEDEFPVRECLRQHALNGTTDVALPVIDRDDDGNLWGHYVI